jgi:hypothetical protein
MAHTVLIVIGSGDIALSELLIRALDEPDITVIPKTNTESALAYIRSTPPDFIVASVTLAADRNSAADPGGGILFCEAARAICPAPMALVTSAITNAVQQRVARMNSPPICVVVDADLPAMLLQQIRAVHAQILRLDITIRADPAGQWSYDLKGRGFEFERSGGLNVPGSLLGALKMVALALSEAKESWREIFYGLGRSIVDGFCDDNPMFGEQLRAGMEAAGGLANTRVTFIVADALYEIALEAISSPLAELPEPWMIHAPLVRSVVSATPADAQLFEGPPRPPMHPASSTRCRIRVGPWSWQRCLTCARNARRCGGCSAALRISSVSTSRASSAATTTHRSRRRCCSTCCATRRPGTSSTMPDTRITRATTPARRR